MPEPGVSAIKPEFIVKRIVESHETEAADSILGKRKLLTNDSEDTSTENAEKKNKASSPSLEGSGEKSKIRKRGQNKARPKTFLDQKENNPCPTIVNIKASETPAVCHYNNCKFIHSPIEYLKNKSGDISKECHIFNIRGMCPRGISCRFASTHITPEGYNIVNEEKFKVWKDDTFNTIDNTLQIQLQKKKYDFKFAEDLVKKTDKRKFPNNKISDETKVEVSDDIKEAKVDPDNHSSGTVTDEDIVKLLPREKKVIDWNDKLYLSPLTTVGNLPFRRICKEFGVDVTCGEMALCESLLKGHKQEWALVKRHSSEDIFGVQICGTNVYTITKTAQLLEENVKVDFVDLNLGCPIELIYRKGGGCGMLHRLPSLEASVRCASMLLSVPFTVKTRTGVYQDKKVAHSLVSNFAEWGASLITVHGRSREARYTRSSDWEYIEMCAKAAAPCPVYGNGDVLSYEDYVLKKETAPSVRGVMIGRGALIKPWIFTEIKEQKIWDISSSERFDILKKYTNYGLEHWGSDTKGVENTRRFLLEWLSFLYRYIPVGVLEKPPQKINERPPIYFGRDDMETLMASGNCSDWIKISEMLLGPVPDGFRFLPKHKANSY